MKTVYLISLCEKIIAKESKILVYFHFKGVYLGQKIDLITLEAKEKFSVAQEYFLLFEAQKVEKNTLYGKVLKSKLID